MVLGSNPSWSQWIILSPKLTQLSVIKMYWLDLPTSKRTPQIIFSYCKTTYFMWRHYYGDIKSISQDESLSLGLPKYFLLSWFCPHCMVGSGRPYNHLSAFFATCHSTNNWRRHISSHSSHQISNAYVSL